MTDRCPICDANLALVGKTHRCQPRWTDGPVPTTMAADMPEHEAGGRGEAKPPFDRKAYQRQYMKRYMNERRTKQRQTKNEA